MMMRARTVSVTARERERERVRMELIRYDRPGDKLRRMKLFSSYG